MHVEYDDERSAPAPTARPRTSSPRQHPRYRDRGPKVHLGITYVLLGQILGRSPRTIRNLATGRDRRFDPSDLRSVLTFVQQRLPAQEEK